MNNPYYRKSKDPLSSITSLDTRKENIENLVSIDEWDLESALKLGSWIARGDPLSDDLLSSFGEILSQWDDNTIFAVIYDEQETNSCLLDLFHEQIDKVVSNIPLLVCLSHIYRALDRIDHLTSLHPNEEDDAEWIESPRVLASAALSLWLGEDNGSNEKVLSAAACILTQLLLHRQDTWLFQLSDEDRNTLCRKLNQHIVRLDDMDMPFTSFTALALDALALQNSIQGKGFTLEETQTTSYIYHAVFEESEWAPRWTKHHGNQQLVHASYLILRIRSMAMTLNDKDLQIGMDFVVNRLEEGHFDERFLSSLHFLLVFHRGTFVNFLRRDSSVFKKDKNTIEAIFDQLVQLIFTRNCLISMAVVRVLLDDRRKGIFDDEFSRRCWTKVDKTFVERLLRTAVSTMSIPYKRSILLGMLSCLYLPLVLDQTLRDNVLYSLSNETLDGLLGSIHGQESKTGPLNSSSLNDSMHSTPEINNLSRTVESRVASADSVVGGVFWLDKTAKLAVGSILAIFAETGSSLSRDEKSVFYCRRIRDCLHKAVCSGSLDVFDDVGSINRSRWRIRLVESYFSLENEDIHARRRKGVSETRNQEVRQLRDSLKTAQQELIESKAIEQELRKQLVQQRMSDQTQRIQIEQELIRLRDRFAKETKEHTESWNLEVESIRRKATESEVQIQHLQTTIKKGEEIVASMRADIEEKQRMLAESETLLSREAEKEHKVRQELERSQQAVAEVKERLQAMEREKVLFQREKVDLNERVHEQDEALIEADETNLSLRDSLETLFGDLCSLVQAYETQEAELKSKSNDSEQVHLLKQKLEHEKRRRRELEEHQKQIEFENETLSRKYERAKLKLQEERETSRNDSRLRSQPLSYFDQLQTSRVSKSNRSSNTNKENRRSANESRERSRSYR